MCRAGSPKGSFSPRRCTRQPRAGRARLSSGNGIQAEAERVEPHLLEVDVRYEDAGR